MNLIEALDYLKSGGHLTKAMWKDDKNERVKFKLSMAKNGDFIKQSELTNFCEYYGITNILKDEWEVCNK
ncbi:MAG: hypothetical protein LBE72_06180 [Rickettsia sp.]|jgi:hypothetical protein|nr:hypothetical protein [Rickettsia sp.]